MRLILAGILMAAPCVRAADIKVACVQMKVYKNIATNRDNIISHIQTQAAQGARVVVFCECALSDYSMSYIQTLSESTINGAVAQIAAACRSNNVYSLVGTPYFDGGIRYNAILVINPNGDIVYRQCKAHVEVEAPTMTDGDKPAIFEIDGIPCTLFICHDERYPELMRMGVYGGAKIAFYTSFEQYTGQPGWKDFNYLCQIVGRAIENQTWTVTCNAPVGNESGDSPGHSRIIGPDGTIHAEAGYDETVISYTFDPDTSSNAWATAGANKPLLHEFWQEGLRVLQVKNPGYFPTVTANPSLQDDIGVIGASANKNLSIALVQMKMTNNIAANAAKARSFIQSQAAAGARLVVFPECALTDKDSAALPSVNQNEIDNALSQVAAQCDSNNVYAIIGSPYRQSNNLYNCAFVIDPDGKIIKRHQQIHTDLPGVLDEGEKMSLFKIDDVYCTVVVGHDIHYPEFYRIANLAGADLCFWISYESASTPVNNSRYLAVCRAVENQTLSIFCNAGTGNTAGDSTGHSLIAGMNGSIYAEATSASDTVVRYTVSSAETKHDYAQNGYNHPTFTTFWQEGLDIIRLNNPEFYGGRYTLVDLKELSQQWLDSETGVPACDPAAHWSFYEGSGTVAHDISGHSNNGTVYGAPLWVNGRVDQAIDFDGSNDYVLVPNSTSISVGGSNYTLSAWIYPHSLSGWRGIVTKVKDLNNKEYAFGLENGALTLEVEANGNNGREATAPVIATNRWQHVMVIFDATTRNAKFYLDGQFQAVVSDTINALPVYSNDNVCIGAWGGTYNNTRNFDGIIDDVKIYNCMPGQLEYDLNHDGAVNMKDFAVFANSWYPE